MVHTTKMRYMKRWILLTLPPVAADETDYDLDLQNAQRRAQTTTQHLREPCMDGDPPCGNSTETAAIDEMWVCRHARPEPDTCNRICNQTITAKGFLQDSKQPAVFADFQPE